MNKIPISVPVYIERFTEDNSSDRYTKAKLKVFYIGETADHRLFTKDFSDKIKDTLPLTPVVGFYSEDADDFVGHNKTQYIYGVVPDGAEISYEEDEETHNTFMVTDVVLYTERQDNIGEIASKIIGKQHSLELDPRTLKYKIHRNGNGSFKCVEFLDGQFIGLSVLGDNETPAFTGSGFFALNPQITEFAAECKEKFSKFIDILNQNGGSIEVFDFENYFNKLQANFAAVTMQDFIQKIYQALENAGVYGFVVENTDSYAIIDTWSDAKSRWVSYKYSISFENDQIVLGESEEVFARYLTQSEIDALDNASANAAIPGGNDSSDDADNDSSDNGADFSDSSDDSSDDSDEGTGSGDNAFVDNNDSSDDSSSDEDNGQEGVAPNASLVQGQEENGQVGTATASACATTLTDSERAELENYRRQEKVAMINEYRKELENELLDNFIADCDKFSKDELEAKLAIEYRKFTKNHQTDDKNKQIAVFGVIAPTEMAGYDPTDSAQVINKYAKKK